MGTLQDATTWQHAYLSIMAVEDINHDLIVESRLNALCEAMGVKFK